MAIEKDLLDQLLEGHDPQEVFGKDGLVDELKRQGNTQAKITIYPDVGHNCWSEAYKPATLYEWLLSHQRVN